MDDRKQSESLINEENIRLNAKTQEAGANTRNRENANGDDKQNE